MVTSQYPYTTNADFLAQGYGSQPTAQAAATNFLNFADGDDIAAFRTPAEDWARLQTGMRPFWQQRAPMQDLGSRMLGRYYLGAPYEVTAEQSNPTFADFLTRYGSTATGTPAMQTLEKLRERARLASQASVYPGGSGAYIAAAAPGDEEDFRRRSVYASLFGSDAENQAANQMAVAQMLAMQRTDPTTGAALDPYKGRMGDAIRRALQGVQQYRATQGAPRESFLDWYLQRFHPASTETTTTA